MRRLLLALCFVLPLVTVALVVPRPTAGAAEVEPGSGSWPLRPRPDVVRGFAAPSSAWGPGHRGADLAGSVGEPVRSAESGTVSFVGRIAGVASIAVDHGATRTTYQPVEASVHRGQQVAQGEVIGRLALAGSHRLPAACLHWGLIAGRTYLDPLVLVGAAPMPVRLMTPGTPLPATVPPDPVGRWSPAPLPASVGGSEPVPPLP